MAKTNKSLRRRKNLLIELGTEELPPRALKLLAESFSNNISQGLIEAQLVEEKKCQTKYFATPRRLGVWIKDVLPKQPDQTEEKRGPAIQAAFDNDGKSTAAANGFAKSCGVEVRKLKQMHTENGSWLVFEKKSKGKNLNSIITEVLHESIARLPIPKRMRWGQSDVEFVRPVHWLLALYGSDPIRTEVLGLKSSGYSNGHRFHCPGKLKIASADHYLSTLKTTGFVIADFQVRQALIVKQVNWLASKVNANAQVDQQLLDEVTGLVEWPVALIGKFDERYLKLPKEVLVSTMVDHQKYFHVTNKKGKILPRFISVSNIKSKSPKRVCQGNERVLRARLSDAEFFWKADQKIKLDERIEPLKSVLFHNKLGSIFDKTTRIEKLAVTIAIHLGVEKLKVERVSRLCKTDLVTSMVGEFPALQGTIGKYYALGQGESKEVSKAIEEHYLPRFSGDALPGNDLGLCVALADKIDSLVGIFAAGEIPTGDKDPFGLRRSALGIIRIIIEEKLDLDLLHLLSEGLQLFTNLNKIDTDSEIVQRVYDFTSERMKGYFQSLEFSLDEILSVQACNPVKPLDFFYRVQSVKKFFRKNKSAAESLAAANKRIANILIKSDNKGDGASKLNRALLSEDAEIHLLESLDSIRPDVISSFENSSYDKGFEKLSTLKQPIDKFFDSVMVMYEDKAIRDNRLALLSELRHLFLAVADISKMRID